MTHLLATVPYDLVGGYVFDPNTFYGYLGDLVIYLTVLFGLIALTVRAERRHGSGT